MMIQIMSRISDRIRYVGVNDDEKSLFEGVWPLPFGISYNSYLVVDKKIALIDTIDEGFEKEYLEKIKGEIGSRVIDYLVINHMEPDHTSLLSLMPDIYPGILIVASERALPMLKGYYGLTDDDVLVVRDRDHISLGSCDLTFHMTPMVHWPETMMTWVNAEKTLFSGDAFGSFGALKHGICDSAFKCECGFPHGKDDAFSMYMDEMTRYYSNIVGKYGNAVQAAMKKIAPLEIKRICSAHGPVWEKQIDEVIGLYDRMSRNEAEPGVCLVFGSMYGNTAEAARSLADELAVAGVPVAVHNLNVENISGALRDLYRYDTLVVGSPTYNGGIFPPVEAFMHAVTARMVRHRSFFAFGSYSWAAASVRHLNEMAGKAGFTLLNEGISFPHAYSRDKCNMKAIAEIIRANISGNS